MHSRVAGARLRGGSRSTGDAGRGRSGTALLAAAGVVAVAFPLSVLAVTLVRGTGSSPAPSAAPVPVASAVPGERSGVAAAWDGAGRRLVLFGGFGRAPALRGQVLGDTWTWTSAAGWERLRLVPSPPARVGAGLVPDLVGGSLLLAGGYGTGGAGPLGDAWSLQDSGWTVGDGSGPVAATLPALVDGDGTPLLVAPGQGGRSTTWRWIQGGWRAVPTTGGPVLGSEAVGVTLPPAGMLLVDRSGTGGGETWRFDGHAWSLLPDAGPAVFRPIGAILAADPSSGRLILAQVGPGSTTVSLLAWSGTAWVPGPPPPPAAPAALVTDTTDHRLLALVPDGSGGLTVLALGSDGWSAAH